MRYFCLTTFRPCELLEIRGQFAHVYDPETDEDLWINEVDLEEMVA